jgi:hypothetical protein
LSAAKFFKRIFDMVDVVQAVTADIAKVKTFEDKVFAFLQAHYTKGVAAVVGYVASHFGLVSFVWGKVF